MCNGTHDTELSNAAHDPATADTAITDVFDPDTIVAGRMHQSRLFCLKKNLQRLFFRESPIDLALIERVLDV